MVWKGKKALETISFFSIYYFFQYFQIFSIFISNETWPKKSYQFFKIYKHFDKEREKTLIQQPMKKENWEKLDFVL